MIYIFRRRATHLPEVTLSRRTFRAVVAAAHAQGMSVDAYLRGVLGQSENYGPRAVSDRPAPGRRFNPDDTGATGLTGGFETVWAAVKALEGAAFRTWRGAEFRYSVDGDYVLIASTPWRVPRSAFRRAFEQWPADRPSSLRGVFAPSHVWAVLADPRVTWPRAAPRSRGRPGGQTGRATT
jgi:hypothetical protein